MGSKLSALVPQLMVGLTIGAVNCLFVTVTNGQSRISTAQTCNQDNASGIVEQQIASTKTFDDLVQRITVLIRAADLLWPSRPDQGRSAFSDAFALATQYHKETGDKTRNEGRLLVQVSDQRYTVITAIAKRDPVWARKLSKRILEEEATEADEKAGKNASRDARTGAKLLGAAASLLTIDQATALGLAQSSLAYPATLQIPFFLFKLAGADKGAADQFYQQALIAYAHAPMEQFLYLSSYPFASRREVGEMPVWAYYTVPAGLAPTPSLQRLFLQTLFRRARELAQNLVASEAGTRWSDASQILMALTRLEPQVTASMGDLSAALQESKANISALLSQGDLQQISETLVDPPKKPFDEQVEAADRLADPGRREGGLANAILNASVSEGLDRIAAAADKIDDPGLRVQLLSRVYFNRAQVALKEGRIDEARKLAAKIDELDQRAYLYSQVATESIKQTKDETAGREMLEDVLGAIAKAPETEVKARALLAMAYLYSKIDPNRSLAVLGDAVKCINRIESVNLSTDYVMKRIEGRTFGFYSTLQTPGFSPEKVFSEIAKTDFDGVLYLASNLTDKSLRAMTTLALAELCLNNQPVPPKSKQRKPLTTKP